MKKIITILFSTSLFALSVYGTGFQANAAPEFIPAKETMASAADTETRKIILSSAGIGSALKVLQVSPENTAVLTFARKDVNDVLRSLSVSGVGLTSVKVRLQGPAGVEDAFSKNRFSPEDLSSMVRLVTKMIGETVIIVRKNDTFEGVIVSAEEMPCVEGVCSSRVTLASDAGLRRVEINDADLVQFRNTETSAEILTSLDVLKENMSTNQMSLIIETKWEPDAPKELFVSHLASMPAWKTSWRSSVDEKGAVKMQAWAIAENPGPVSWRDVDLELSVGAPRLIAANLYERHFDPRETQEQKIAPLAPPMARGFNLMESFASAEIASGASMDMVSAPVASVTSTESQTITTFALAEKISLNPGEMISVPYLDAGFDSTFLSRHIAKGYSHEAQADSAILLKNSSDMTLPGGVVSVSATSGHHLGDTQMEDLSPEETSVLVFGTDQKTSINEIYEPGGFQRSIEIDRGVLKISESVLHRTTYEVEAPASEGRTIRIEHPANRGWSLVSVTGDSAEAGEIGADGTLEGYLPIVIDHIHGSKGRDYKVEVVEESQSYSEVMVMDAADDFLLSYQGLEMSAEDRKLIDDVISVRRKMSDIEAQMRQMEAEISVLKDDQSRARQNLSAMNASGASAAQFQQSIMDIDASILAKREELRIASENRQSLIVQLNEILQ